MTRRPPRAKAFNTAAFSQEHTTSHAAIVDELQMLEMTADASDYNRRQGRGTGWEGESLSPGQLRVRKDNTWAPRGGSGMRRAQDQWQECAACRSPILSSWAHCPKCLSLSGLHQDIPETARSSTPSSVARGTREIGRQNPSREEGVSAVRMHDAIDGSLSTLLNDVSASLSNFMMLNECAEGARGGGGRAERGSTQRETVQDAVRHDDHSQNGAIDQSEQSYRGEKKGRGEFVKDRPGTQAQPQYLLKQAGGSLTKNDQQQQVEILKKSSRCQIYYGK